MAPSTPSPGQALQLGIQLGILSQLVQTRMSQLLAPAGMTYTQVALMSHLWRSENPATISELASALEINQPGVTKVVQRLEAAGLLTVQPSETDRRQKLVSVSDVGVEQLGQTLELIGADLAGWFEGWTAGQTDSFGQQLNQLVGWLDQHRLSDDAE